MTTLNASTVTTCAVTATKAASTGWNSSTSSSVTFTFAVKIVDQAPLSISGPSTLLFPQTVSLKLAGGSGGGYVSVAVSGSCTYSMDSSTISLYADVNATKCGVKVTKAASNAPLVSYRQAESPEFSIIFNRETCTTTKCEVGMIGPGGGIVFYKDTSVSGFDEAGVSCSPNCHYLEAASIANADYSPNSPQAGTVNWTDVETDFPITLRALGATGVGDSFTCGTSTDTSHACGTAVGTGMSNSKALTKILQQGNNYVDQPYKAVDLARSYRGPNNLSDWFLPSKDEAGKFMDSISTAGNGPGFAYSGYWTNSTTKYWIANYQHESVHCYTNTQCVSVYYPDFWTSTNVADGKVPTNGRAMTTGGVREKYIIDGMTCRPIRAFSL